MTSPTSVVTPDRFAEGITDFAVWMKEMPGRQDEFQAHYDAYTPDAEDVAALKELVAEHGVKALILGEHWCPDVWRGLPVMVKVAEQTGMEVRMFFRDQHKDIMAEFLKDGEFESIPTIVFYDGDHNYLGHWIERPNLAAQEMKGISAEVMPNGFPPADDPKREEVMARYRKATFDAAKSWRHAQTKEVRALLEAALKDR